MAAAGRPVSELSPLGGAVSMESTHFDSSRSSEPAVSPSRLAAEPGQTPMEEPEGEEPEEAPQEEPEEAPQEEPEEAPQEVCEEHPTTPLKPTNRTTSVRVSEDPGEQGHYCTHSSVETHTPSQHQELGVNTIGEDPRAARPVQSTRPASLPVHRGHSDSLPPVTRGTPPLGPDTDACGLAYLGGEKSTQEAEGPSMLACKLPMQLQPCNVITTVCGGATRGDGGVQRPLSGRAGGLSPEAEARVESVGLKDPPHPECDEALCCGSLVHPGTFGDTFAAFCHPEPIPAPSQVLPRQVGSSCHLPCAGAPPSALNHLPLPRLFSSVSETGLDPKHLLRCCDVSCSWIGAPPPGAGPQSRKHFGLTRDTGTMTAHKELRDVGVQTGHAVISHVLPQICPAEEGRSETCHTQTPNNNRDGGKKPVKEVRWDAEGMTWEVYGASVDPEELGVAIQRHLELQIRETASRAAKLTRQNTNVSRRGGSNGCERKRSRMMGSIPTPGCCARGSTAVD